MGRFIKMSLAVFISTVALAATPLTVKYKNEIQRDKVGIAKLVKSLKGEDGYTRFQNVHVTGFSNEIMLQEMGSTTDRLRVGELHLIFPDVRYVDKYIENVSRNVGYVVIYLLSEETDVEGLEYRDASKIYENNLDKRLEKLANITVISVKVDKKDLTKIIPNSVNRVVFEDEIVKKYINIR